MTDLAKLVVRLEAETAKYQSELDKAKKQLGGFQKDSNKAIKQIGAGVATAAVAAATGLAVMVKSSIDAADEMAQLAEKTGISTESLSGLSYAANLANVSNEDLSKSLAKLAKTTIDAAQGGKQQAAAFKALGVSVKDSQGNIRETDQILLDIAERFSQLEDGAAKAAIAQDIFGKSGAALIPFLNQGKEGIAALVEEAEKLGIIIGDKTAKEADAFNDNLDRLKAASMGIATQLAARLLPHLVQLTDRFIELAKDGDKLNEIVDGIVAAFKTFATIGVAVNTVFQAVGRTIASLVAAFSKLDLSPMDFTSPINMSIALARNAKNAGEAWSTFKIGMTDVADSVSTNIDRMTSLWATQDEKLQEVTVTAKKLKETLNYGMGGDSGLEEIKINAQKVEDSPMVAFYRELDELTQTQKEKALGSIEAQKAALEHLHEYRKVTDEEYLARMEEIQKSENDVLGITKRQEESEKRLADAMNEGKRIFEETRTPLEKYNAELTKLNILKAQGAIDVDTFNRAVAQSKEAYEKATDGAAAFYEEAKENAQDILGQGIYDSIKDGFDRGAGAALDTFADMLLRMATEAIAANIMGSLFGNNQGSTSLFGGSRDSGGRGQPGMAYAIGTGAQPEMFVPDTPGRFMPRDEWMGAGQTVQQNFYIEAPKGTVSRQTQMQIGASASKNLQNANRRNN